MKFHYHKQQWLNNFYWGQVFKFFKPMGGGIGLVFFCHEIALIKGENKLGN